MCHLTLQSNSHFFKQNPLKISHNFVSTLHYLCKVLLFTGDPLYIPLRSIVLLTFIGPYIINIFQYISNKMQLYTVYLYLETALHVLGGTSTHHQERIQLYLQRLVFVTPILLPAAQQQVAVTV